jgi:hypothetical protein
VKRYPDPNEIQISCCFCGQTVDHELTITVEWPRASDDDKGMQWFWAHRSCFTDRLRDDFRSGPVTGEPA